MPGSLRRDMEEIGAAYAESFNRQEGSPRLTRTVGPTSAWLFRRQSRSEGARGDIRVARISKFAGL
jgi:hypothetical protein